MGGAQANWNDFSRVNASQRWRQASAAMGRDVTQAIVVEAQVASGMRVLDVASGTGEPAISIATLLRDSGSVVATDISPEPLKVGSQRAHERGLTNIEFRACDVHKLPFPDGSFDRVTSRLGVMFFSDLPRAFREIHRVLKPNGRFSILAWGPMEQPYFETTIGTILRLTPDARVPASAMTMFKFGKLGVLAAALREAGFSRVEERFEDVPWNWPGSPEDFWAYFQEVTIPFKPVFSAIAPERRNEVQAAVLEALRSHVQDGYVKFAARVVLASAVW